jgi:hypothetical protein
VSYNDFINSSVPLTGETSTLITEIESYNTDPDAGTCIACAIEESLNLLSATPAGTEKFVVLMSDGFANVRDDYASSDWDGDGDVDASDDAIARACEYNSALPNEERVIYYTVGMGPYAGEQTLRLIADCSKTDGVTTESLGSYFHGKDAEEMALIYEEITELVGKAALDETNTKYGGKSMLLDASSPPYNVISDAFPLPHDDADYMIAFYSMLDISQGSFEALIHFYVESGDHLGSQVVGALTEPQPDFVRSNFTVHAPPGAAKASLEFRFSGAGTGDEARVDDVYLGPPVSCVPEGDAWRCGEILIEKTSENGDLYPYFERQDVAPGEHVVFKDGNCAERHCSYKIVSPASLVDVNVAC